MWVRNGMTLGTKWYDLGTALGTKWYGTRAHGYEMTCYQDGSVDRMASLKR